MVLIIQLIIVIHRGITSVVGELIQLLENAILPPPWIPKIPIFVLGIANTPTVGLADTLVKVIGICTLIAIAQVLPDVENLPNLDLDDLFREEFGEWNDSDSQQQKEPEPQPKPQPWRVGPDIIVEPKETQEPDYIWRGIGGLIPKARDFRPRAQKDMDGLSFWNGRESIWDAMIAVEETRRKPYRAGFTATELIAAGFSLRYDPSPPGHVGVQRINQNEWISWLNATANTPEDIYSSTLANMVQPHRIEPNVAP